MADWRINGLLDGVFDGDDEMNDRLERVADVLRQAELSRVCCGRVTDMETLSVADAYAVQRINVNRRLEQGLFGVPVTQIGWKIGLTSEAVQRWLSVDQPDFGTLMSDMVVLDGATVPPGILLQPRAEAELAFVLKQDLAGPGVTVAKVIQATDFILPAIEIIDSRIQDWKITYCDTVADNASCGMFVLGNTPVSLSGLDLRLLGMVLRKNGTIVSTGAGAACLGNPLHAMVWLANTLGELDETLRAGDVILSGALGAVTPVQAGDHVEAQIHGVGSCSVLFS